MRITEKEFSYFNRRKPEKDEIISSIPFKSESTKRKFEELLNHQHAGIGAFFTDGLMKGNYSAVKSLCQTLNDLYKQDYINHEKFEGN